MDVELSKLNLDNKLDILMAISLLWYKIYDGWACDKCGVIQGEPKKGWKKYYCEHMTSKIDNKLAKEQEKITSEVLKYSQNTGKVKE